MVSRTVGRRDSEQHVGGGTCLSLTGFRYARRPDLDTRGGSSWEELRALVENPENHLQQLKNIDEKFIEKIVLASHDIDAQYDWGHTALAVAVLWKNFTVAKKLFEAGADPSVPDKIGFSAKDFAKLYDLDLFKPKPKRKRTSSFF